MTLVLHTCDHCGSQYSSPLAASLCCDVISNDLDDVSPQVGGAP